MIRIPYPLPTLAPEQSPDLHRDGWRYACEASAVGPMMPLAVEVAGETLLVCRDGDRIVVIDEMCPHKVKSMRFGVVFDGTIMCPHHQYRFDLGTGRANVRRCDPLRIFESRVEDGQVWVRAFDTESTPA